MIKRVHSVGFTVADLDQAKHFYTQVLPFEWVSETEVTGEAYEQLVGMFGVRFRVARLRLGAEEMQLTQYLTPTGGRPIPTNSRSHDLWFQHIAMVVGDMDSAYERLREHNVQHVSSMPQTLPEYIESAAGIKAFYFRDPDGHNLELIWFPLGKGDPYWQRQNPVFLGIDHTAIAVHDTTISSDTYGHSLGMICLGESTNYGPEQEHLNGVFGSRVRITGWRPPDTTRRPGIEFLEYLAPPGGNALPADTQPNDLWHWETTLVVDDIQQAFATLRNARTQLVSPHIIDLPDSAVFGYKRAFITRDVDGHALKIVEE